MKLLPFNFYFYLNSHLIQNCSACVFLQQIFDFFNDSLQIFRFISSEILVHETVSYSILDIQYIKILVCNLSE